MHELFELSFINDNRVVFIIGPHQSGKTRLIKLLLEYFLSKLGSTASYLFCQI
jgi:predicted AAA+ superfamily ATPase